MILKKPVAELIKVRSSWRKYSKNPISPEIVQQINDQISGLLPAPFQTPIRFQIIEDNISSKNEGLKLGTYGFISGARYFMAGAIKKEPNGFEDYGYLLEKIILFLTDLNLGTCWLGGTFKRSHFAQAMNLDQGEIIPAITPFGYPSSQRGLKDKLIRLSAGSKNRKSWEEIFFSTHFSNPLTQEEAGSYKIPLEMLRLSPSASNKQPWRILCRDGLFHFFLKRTKNYQGMFKDVDLQRIDIGIAMCHFEQTALQLNLEGLWKTCDLQEFSNDLNYITSWSPKQN